MGFKGYKGPGAQMTARKKTIDFKSDDKKPAPIPLAKCPWCGSKFTRDSLFLMADGKGNPDFPKGACRAMILPPYIRAAT